MPEILKAAPGSFCWIEHASAEPAAAKAFYGELLGWNWVDAHTMSDGSRYAMGQLRGVNVGGCTTLQGRRDVPPRWLSYLAVDDAGAAFDSATRLGARALLPVEDVGSGRIGLLKDPGGAPFALWQARRSMGGWLYAENGAMCWNELVTGKVEGAAEFYAGLFGWQPGGDASTYVLFASDDDIIGGMLPTPKDRPDTPPQWVVYFQVPDTDAAVASTPRLKGSVVVPATEQPGVGRWAVLRDPLGVMFGVLQR